MQPRTAFFGTPALAVPSLEALHEVSEIVRVFCQPDRAAGRGMKQRPPPVKARAQELGLVVEQPRRVRRSEFAASLRALELELALVVAYGRILPLAVLDAPRLGCVNLHASLLPRWRGAGPIQWAVASGDRETGICLMQMDEGMDTGPVLATQRVSIGDEETAGALGVRLGQVAAEVVRREIPRLFAGELTATRQSEEGVTHARMLSKDDGWIDWHQSAAGVHNWVRGMHPWPGACFSLPDGTRVKVHRAAIEHAQGVAGAPGTVLAGEGLHVACATGTVLIGELQLDGKRRLRASDFLSGHPIPAGTRLGSGGRDK